MRARPVRSSAPAATLAPSRTATSSPGIQRRTPPPEYAVFSVRIKGVADRERSSAARHAGEGGCPATKPGARDVARTAGRRTDAAGNARPRPPVGPRRRGCGEAAQPRAAAAGGHGIDCRPASNEWTPRPPKMQGRDVSLRPRLAGRFSAEPVHGEVVLDQPAVVSGHPIFRTPLS